MPGAHSCTVEGCYKSFRDNWHLESHLLTHTGEKPFCCRWKGCSRRFAQTSHLNMHIKGVHKGEKPFRCQWKGCSYRVSQKGPLDQHISAVHRGEKPFRCQWKDCDFSTARSMNLKEHVRIHTGDKPHSCKWKNCTYRCAQRGDLATHMKGHKGEAVPCPVAGCDYASIRTSHVKRHIQKMHSESGSIGLRRKGVQRNKRARKRCVAHVSDSSDSEAPRAGSSGLQRTRAQRSRERSTANAPDLSPVPRADSPEIPFRHPVFPAVVAEVENRSASIGEDQQLVLEGEPDSPVGNWANLLEMDLNGVCVSYPPDDRPRLEHIFGLRSSHASVPLDLSHDWDSVESLDRDRMRVSLLDFRARFYGDVDVAL